MGNEQYLKYIRDNVPERALLEQLAEELSEAAQAALKLIRAKTQENPTPVTEEEARKHLVEEAGDVLIALGVLGLIQDTRGSDKWSRWAKRIRDARRKPDEVIHAHWVPDEDDWTPWMACSHCGHRTLIGAQEECPVCRAVMDEGREQA